MTEVKTWKQSRITVKNLHGVPVDVPVRTDGTVFQIWSGQSVTLPYAEDLEDWFESIRSQTHDLEDRKIGLDDAVCLDSCVEDGGSIFVSGWRSWLTADEKKKISQLTFS